MVPSRMHRLRTRIQSTNLERDELAELRCVELPTRVLRNGGSSCWRVGSPGLAITLQDLDTDRRAKTETELFDKVAVRRILGYRWRDHSERLGYDIVGKRQLRFHGYVARILADFSPIGFCFVGIRGAGP